MFPLFFGCALVIAAFFTWQANKSSKEDSARPEVSEAFSNFRRLYHIVYYLMMAGDWLQGPYVYALYASYGFSKDDIAVLFVAGFGSSMVFGTFVGGLADRFGRKRFCLIYIVCYIASCVTKHFASYSILMTGRILGGVSTSLLFSVFDAWLVYEHNDQKFEKSSLGTIFSWAIFGNSIVAVLAGVLAQWASGLVSLTSVTGTDFYFGGYCTPFDLAICFLLIGGTILSSTWNENYGVKPGVATEPLFSADSMKRALGLIIADERILICGLVQSLFEGAMYSFVFMWTPALEQGSVDPLPFGLIFATFMVSCMAGSSIFTLLMKGSGMTVENLLAWVFPVAALSLGVGFLTAWLPLLYSAFLLFELCVGVYFPAMGTLKSRLVPEEARAAIYNIFRVPLNLIVLFVLLNHLPTHTVFLLCASLLGLAAVLQRRLLFKIAAVRAASPPGDVELEKGIVGSH